VSWTETRGFHFIMNIREIRNRLKTTHIVNGIQSYQLNWKQHVDRMVENRFPKKLLNYKLTGTRDIGRPRSRWKDQF
jgi:hypothetical protein